MPLQQPCSHAVVCFWQRQAELLTLCSGLDLFQLCVVFGPGGIEEPDSVQQDGIHIIHRSKAHQVQGIAHIHDQHLQQEHAWEGGHSGLGEAFLSHR